MAWANDSDYSTVLKERITITYDEDHRQGHAMIHSSGRFEHVRAWRCSLHDGMLVTVSLSLHGRGATFFPKLR